MICRILPAKLAWSYGTNMSWDTNQAITSMTPGGARSKSNCARPRAFLPLVFTLRPDTTRRRTEGFSYFRKFSVLVAGLLFLFLASSSFAQIPVQTPPPPAPPGQQGNVSPDGKI